MIRDESKSLNASATFFVYTYTKKIRSSKRGFSLISVIKKKKDSSVFRTGSFKRVVQKKEPIQYSFTRQQYVSSVLSVLISTSSILSVPLQLPITGD